MKAQSRCDIAFPGILVFLAHLISIMVFPIGLNWIPSPCQAILKFKKKSFFFFFEEHIFFFNLVR